MPEVKYFIYCEGIQPIPTKQGIKTNLNGPLMVLTPLFIPCTYSFAISLGLQGFDPNAKNKLQIIFKGPVGEVVQDTGLVELPTNVDKTGLSPKYVGFSLNMDFRNVVLKEEGEYVSTVILNGETLGSYTIPVIKSEKNG